MKLWIQTPPILINNVKDYCDAIYIETKEGFHTNNAGKNQRGENSWLKSEHDIVILDYKHRRQEKKLVEQALKENKILCLDSSLERLKTTMPGTRVDLGLQIRQKYEESPQLGLINIATSMREFFVFNEIVGCELLVTWWPIALGVSGRDLDEEWPQLYKPDNEMPPSTAWLTYILKRFREQIQEV